MLFWDKRACLSALCIFVHVFEIQSDLIPSQTKVLNLTLVFASISLPCWHQCCFVQVRRCDTRTARWPRFLTMGWMHKILVDFKHFTGYDLSIVLAVSFAISAFSCVYTRVTSGNSGSSSKPPSLPYWTPFVGHLPKWLFDYDAILEKMRQWSEMLICVDRIEETHEAETEVSIIDRRPNLEREEYCTCIRHGVYMLSIAFKWAWKRLQCGRCDGRRDKEAS